jgi:hypothetical protein
MSKQDDNKAVVGRWFTEFWGKDVSLAVVDEIAAPDMLLKYSLHAPRHGRDDIKAFMRRRLCRRSVGRRGNPHRFCLQRLSRWQSSRRDRPQDALHGHDGPEGDRRQNCGGGRPRRRRHRADPARSAQGRRLIERGPLLIAASISGVRFDRSTRVRRRACSRSSRRWSGSCC